MSPQSAGNEFPLVTTMLNLGNTLPSDRSRGLRAGAHRWRERHQGRHQRLGAARGLTCEL
eukprot:COSAG01_NODE_69158_length_262_cov_0.631902_1_plen_59_part_10